jgi:hypothetical protein
VAVFNFEVSADVRPELGARFARLVAADLSTLSPVSSVPEDRLSGLSPQPRFNTAESIAPDAAGRLGRRVGAVALVNGRMIFAGRNATIVAKVIDADTGRVYGESVQGDLGVSLEDLASRISVKIAALVLQSRGLPATAWAPATMLQVPGAIMVVDGSPPRGAADLPLTPGLHDVLVSYSRNGASTRARFMLRAQPGATYQLVLRDEPNQRVNLWIADASSSAQVTTSIGREWIKGGDNPLVCTATYPLPGPRSGVAAVADDEAIYVIGGEEKGGRHSFLGDIVRFDLHSHECVMLTQTVFQRGFLGAALVGGKIYIMGGDAKYATLHTMQVYDIAGKTLSDGPSMPHARRGFATVVVGNRIYVMGGSITPPSSTTKVDVFDATTQTWTNGPEMLSAADGQAVPVDHRIVFPGGFRGDMRATRMRGDIADVQALDLREGKWDFLPPLDEPMGGSAVAALNGWVFLLGAFIDSNRAMAYDVGTGRSDDFDIGEKGARNSVAVTVGRAIYVIGGNVQSGHLAFTSDNINVFEENPNWKSDAGRGEPLAGP